MFAEDIIIKPLLTEKGYDGLADKKYMFIVRKSADKTQIKQAVEKLFGVDVKYVRQRQHGKLQRQVEAHGQKRRLHTRLQESNRPAYS